jgi:hypothetical protein
VGVLDRVNARARRGRGDESRYGIDTWISDYLIPSAGQFTYGNTTYPFGTGLSQSLAGNRAAEIANTLPGYRAALQACPPAFAAQMVRALVLSQARFTFRNPPWHRATPRRTFGNPDLALLERPWENGTTGELVSRMEWHAGLAGNAFAYRQPSRLRLLRPDWTAIIYGSQTEPEWPSGELDAELLGYVYANRGIGAGEPHFLLPKDMAHWAPLPDPEMTGLGMSWLTPAIREMQGDRLASEHKIRFFEQGATPNLVVKGIPAVDRDVFLQLVEDMEERHAGVANAYRTLYLTAGADASVIGSNLADLDLKAVQGTNETRLSVLSRVPAAVLGISEGLAERGELRDGPADHGGHVGVPDPAGPSELAGVGGDRPSRRGAVVRHGGHADPAGGRAGRRGYRGGEGRDDHRVRQRRLHAGVGGGRGPRPGRVAPQAWRSSQRAIAAARVGPADPPAGPGGPIGIQRRRRGRQWLTARSRTGMFRTQIRRTASTP